MAHHRRYINALPTFNINLRLLSKVVKDNRHLGEIVQISVMDYYSVNIYLFENRTHHFVLASLGLVSAVGGVGCVCVCVCVCVGGGGGLKQSVWHSD